jgi:hypothetical protein
VFEAAAIAALVPFGLSRPVALSFALVAHAVQVLFYVAAGGAVLIMRLTPARAVAGRPR